MSAGGAGAAGGIGAGLAGHGSGLARLHKREERAGSSAGGQEGACQALLAVRGGSTTRGSPGGPGPGTSPPPAATPFPGSPRGCHKGSRLTRPERLAPGRGGHSQPRIPSPGWRPSPALMSAGLAAFQLIFCPMLCLPSGLLQGPGQGGDTHTQPPGPRRGLPAGSWSGFTPSRGAEPQRDHQTTVQK